MNFPKKISSFILPSALILSYAVFALFLKDFFPNTEEVFQDFAKIFAKYGYEIIFFGAFLEAALIIDLFAPGTSIVLAGAYFSSIGILSYPIFLIVAASGFLLGYLVDYLVGYLGFSDILTKFGLGKELDIIRNSVEKMGFKAFFLGYFHPDSATLFAVSAGIIKMNILKFLSYNLLAGSFWLVFWTLLVFIFGKDFQKIFHNHLLVWVVISIPISYIIIKSVGFKKIINLKNIIIKK